VSPRKIWQSSGDQKKDQNKDKATLFNTPLLYNRAEELKMELSDQDTANRDFPLRVIVGDDVRPLESLTQGKINVSISTAKLTSLLADELHQTFVDIDTMLSENGGHLPEIVILAGQSSKMPVVKEMLTTHFQKKYHTDNVDIQLSESPKECVAIGAAQYGMTYSMPATVWFDIRNFRKTHTSIGIMQFDGTQQVFEEIIPKGKLIPDKSVGTTDFPLRTREIYIDVRERFGKNGKLSPIDDYILRLPKDVSKEALRTAQLKMVVENEGEIKVIAIVDGKEYESEVEKKEPEFVDEI
jgi:molecular chaperone DnaK (HSP70)